MGIVSGEALRGSGKLFLKGFEAASSCKVPSKPIEDNQRMVTFKAWAQTGTPYFASVQGLKSGDHEAHAMRARSRRRSLENMYAELNEDHGKSPIPCSCIGRVIYIVWPRPRPMIVKLYRNLKSARRRKDATTSASTWTGRSSGSARETRARRGRRAFGRWCS